MAHQFRNTNPYLVTVKHSGKLHQLVPTHVFSTDDDALAAMVQKVDGVELVLPGDEDPGAKTAAKAPAAKKGK